eukprot:jgi/Psemu1/41810/gm1.41810_g
MTPPASPKDSGKESDDKEDQINLPSFDESMKEIIVSIFLIKSEKGDKPCMSLIKGRLHKWPRFLNALLKCGFAQELTYPDGNSGLQAIVPRTIQQIIKALAKFVKDLQQKELEWQNADTYTYDAFKLFRNQRAKRLQQEAVLNPPPPAPGTATRRVNLRPIIPEHCQRKAIYAQKLYLGADAAWLGFISPVWGNHNLTNQLLNAATELTASHTRSLSPTLTARDIMIGIPLLDNISKDQAHHHGDTDTSMLAPRTDDAVYLRPPTGGLTGGFWAYNIKTGSWRVRQQKGTSIPAHSGLLLNNAIHDVDKESIRDDDDASSDDDYSQQSADKSAKTELAGIIHEGQVEQEAADMDTSKATQAESKEESTNRVEEVKEELEEHAEPILRARLSGYTNAVRKLSTDNEAVVLHSIPRSSNTTKYHGAPAPNFSFW